MEITIPLNHWIVSEEPNMCTSLIARFMGPAWGPSGAYRIQVGPMLAPWTLLSGVFCSPGHIASFIASWWHQTSTPANIELLIMSSSGIHHAFFLNDQYMYHLTVSENDTIHCPFGVMWCFMCCDMWCDVCMSCGLWYDVMWYAMWCDVWCVTWSVMWWDVICDAVSNVVWCGMLWSDVM